MSDRSPGTADGDAADLESASDRDADIDDAVAVSEASNRGETTATRRRVLARWGRVTAGAAVMVGLALLSLSLSPPWAGGPPAIVLATVGAVLALESILVFGLLAGGSPERDSAPAPAPEPVSLATWITVSRGAAIAVLAGFVVTAPTAAGANVWLPAALFAVAAALDAVDGAVARATGRVTDFGARLDVEMDALVVLVGALVGVREGSLPALFLAVAGARYLFVAGRWWRRRRGRPVFELPPNRLRRPLGALAMLAVWLALLPVPGDAVSSAFAAAVAVPFLANFCWDWFGVTGRVGGE